MLAACVGSRVVLYEASSGKMKHSLKGHKDVVYSTSFAHDGTRVASAGADNTVVVWSKNGEGLFKYSHSESVVSVKFCTVSHSIASVTASELGMWSSSQKGVNKHRITGKGLCCVWSTEGEMLAVGTFSGKVSLRDNSGKEKRSIDVASSPVWDITFRVGSSGDSLLVLAVWNGTVLTVNASGSTSGIAPAHVMDRTHNSSSSLALQPSDSSVPKSADPLSLSWLSRSEGSFLLRSSTNGCVDLCNADGNKLVNLEDKQHCWPWCIAARPNSTQVAIGSEDGVQLNNVTFGTVHALYREHYAYRESLTDVIVQNLTLNQQLRIRCRDYVKKVAVFKDRLAVQLNDRAMLYELASTSPTTTVAGDGAGTLSHTGVSAAASERGGMHYRVKAKIHDNLECNLLVVTYNHIVICQEKRLRAIAPSGHVEQEWSLDSPVRYIKALGGPVGGESLLLGLKNGYVKKVFMNNPFPLHIISHGEGIRCLDMPPTLSQLAVVDEHAKLCVYSLPSLETVFTANDVSSASFNMEHDDLLCYSSNGSLHVRTSGLSPIKEQQQGFVIGFKETYAFVLHQSAVRTVDVPLSSHVRALCNKGELHKAYSLACLGVPHSDWRTLGTICLKAGELEHAHRAFARVGDVMALDLVSRTQDGVRAGRSLAPFIAEAIATEGKIEDAANSLSQAGKAEEAVEMLSEMGMFEEAKRHAEAGGKDVKALLAQQAAWCEERSDFRAATELHISSGQPGRAVHVCERAGLSDRMAEVARELDPHSEREHIKRAAAFLQRNGLLHEAAEAYSRLGDSRALVQLHIKRERWNDAIALANAHPELAQEVYLPRARTLVGRQEFDAARLAYKQAGRHADAARLLQSLAQCSVYEKRFTDAAHYFWLMADEVLSMLRSQSKQQSRRSALLNRFWRLYRASEIYYVYSFVYDSTEQPFRTLQPEALLNAARFLLMRLAAMQDWQNSSSFYLRGISRSRIYIALTQEGERLGAYRLAREAHNRLQGLRLSNRSRDRADIDALIARAQPLRDSDDLLECCFRCGTTNPLLGAAGDVCINCGTSFQRSLASFDLLPLVEFQLDEGISEAEARSLIDTPPPPPERTTRRRSSDEEMMMEKANGDAQAISFEEQNADKGGLALLDEEEEEDPLEEQLATAATSQPLVASRDSLSRMKRSQVVVQSFGAPGLPARFFKLVDPSLSVNVDETGHIYEAEELDMLTLEHGVSPIAQVELENLEVGSSR